LIQASFDESRRRYGSPRIHEDLRLCASPVLCLTGPGQRTFTSKLSNMLGTPAAVDAKNAPTAAWKTPRTGFPRAPTGGIACLQGDTSISLRMGDISIRLDTPWRKP
jgi:hypothetical protein